MGMDMGMGMVKAFQKHVGNGYKKFKDWHSLCNMPSNAKRKRKRIPNRIHFVLK